MDSTTFATHPIDPREKKKYYLRDTPQRHLMVGAARVIFKLVMKLNVSGLENLPPQGPVILAANHVTNFDVFPMQFALSRPIFFMGKAELFRNPLLEVLLRNLGGFPVNRGEKDQWAIRQAAKVLKYGQVLGMFPEGKRSRGRGLAVAKTGVARLALETKSPIVPVAVIGSDKFFERFPHRARVSIELLQPIVPKPGETPLALTDRLMFTLAQSLPEEMRGVYAEMPKGFAMQM